MDVRQARLATKTPNFVIQESITINNGKITSCYSPASAPAAAAGTQRDTPKAGRESLKLADKQFLLGLQRKVASNTPAAGKVQDAREKKMKQKNAAVRVKGITKSQDGKAVSNVLAKSVFVQKAVPTPVIVSKAQLHQERKNVGTSAVVQSGQVKPVIVNNSGNRIELVDFEDIIPTSLTHKQNSSEIAISSEVTLHKAARQSSTAGRRKPKNAPHQEAVTITRKPLKPRAAVVVYAPPTAQPAKAPEAAQPAQPTVPPLTATSSTSSTATTKKKPKKKKRRFRNLDAPDDEDDWPMPPLILIETKKPPTPDQHSTVAPVTIKEVPEDVKDKATKEIQDQDKVQVHREYIFPSPSNPTGKRDKPAEKEKDKDKETKDKKPDKKDKMEEDKLTMKREKSLTSDDGHLSDDSVSSIQSKMSAISDFNLNGSYGDVDGLNLDGSSTDLATPQPEGEEADILCAYDDDGNLVCLQKATDGQFSLAPAEENQQQEVSQNLNNNSLEIESKEEKLDRLTVGGAVPKVATTQREKNEEELLQSSQESLPFSTNPKEENKPLEKEEVEEVARDEDDSPGILPETIENVGNEEIVAEPTTPEELVQLPTNKEPIYGDTYISCETPMELAFVEALKEFQESANDVESSKDESEKVEAYVETLLKVQDQCEIIEYQPSSDESDVECADESVANVNDLSQVDIAKMVLGEGFGARLVSDQEEAVDLLQVPPDYKPTPLVLHPVGKLVPVSVSPLIVDAHAQKKLVATHALKLDTAHAHKLPTVHTSELPAAHEHNLAIAHAQTAEVDEVEMHAEVKKETKHRKPLGIGSSTPVAKTKRKYTKSSSKGTHKKNIKLFPHVTGDSEFFADVDERDDEDGFAFASPIRPLVAKGRARADQAVMGRAQQLSAVKRTMWSPDDSSADTDESGLESSRNSSLISLDDESTVSSHSELEAETPSKKPPVKRKIYNRLFGKRPRKQYLMQKKRSREGASLDSTASHSVSSSEESAAAGEKVAKIKKPKTKVDWLAITGGKSMSTRKKVPVDVAQSMGNLEVNLSMIGNDIKEEIKEENEIKQEPEEPTNEVMSQEVEANGYRTPSTSPSRKKSSSEWQTSPKSGISPLKLKITNLLGKTPSRSTAHDESVEVKTEPSEAEDHNEQQRIVPKIVLKLSPHKSPSIIRSPSASPRKLDYKSTPSKGKSGKRKILSPLAFADELQDNVSPSSSGGGKLKKSKKGKSTSGDELNRSQPLLTDDPELIINLPIDKENTKNLMNVKHDNDLNANGGYDSDGGDFKVKEEHDEDDEGNKDDDSFKVGDLVLARLGSFCFWPCMVTVEPKSNKYLRKSKRTINYHVRFFGDNGRRAWVLKSAILTYDGYDMLNKHKEALIQRQMKIAKHKPDYKTLSREIAACQIKGSFKRAWSTGMKELQDLVDKSVDERHDFFFQMFASKREKAQASQKRKRQLSENEMVEIKKELDDLLIKNEEPEVEEFSEKPPLKKRKYEKKAKKASPSTPKSTTSHDGRQSSRSSKSTPTSSKVRLNQLESPGADSESKRSYVIEDLELIIKGSLTMKDIKEEDEEKLSRQLRPKRSSADSKEPRKELKSYAKKQLDVGGADISDSDSTSKTSVQSGNGNSNPNKRYLFKDVPKQPVCSVCLQNGGSLVKCKGTCFAFYHPECSQLKDEPKDEEDDVIEEPKVEIVNVKTKTKYFNKDEVNLNQSDMSWRQMNLNEQLDHKLNKIMAPIASTTNYHASTTESSSDEVEVVPDDEGDSQPAVKTEGSTVPPLDFICINCKHGIDPPCFACGRTVYLEKHVDRFRCSIYGCGKYFHPECLNAWPQAIIDLGGGKDEFSFKCPMHNCQTCISDNPKASSSLLPISKTVRCVKCPAAYHANAYCVPAGTEVLSHSQIICPRHVQHKSTKRYTINANWCFLCSQGGDLMCCETCPTSVHADCIRINLRADDSFVCEDCESGRLPLYDEIVWVKFAAFKWWPAVILFPEDVPENVRQAPHRSGEFVARFYGTHDHHWFALGRVFLFQEDDIVDTGGDTIGRHDLVFKKAVEEAKAALICRKQLKLQRDLALRKNEKPPAYTKIKVNRVVGNLKPFDGNVSNTNACNCTDSQPNPCGPGSDCLNRLLLTECEPEVCPARDKCRNQRFEKRLYPPLVPYKTETRGWGLKSTKSIVKGQFVIEYVGELIDQEEYQRRIDRMHLQKAENYYFLTLDGSRTIDAGPKGNLARFMNHCCQPNCETQKWTVRGDTRIGLFALEDIPANTELTFNYNMEPIGDEKKECRCGAKNCARFLGAKNKDMPKVPKPAKVAAKKAKTKKLSTKKLSAPAQEPIPPSLVPCFICGVEETDLDCTMKNCGKVYHIKCMELFSKPQGKWTCPRHYCNVCAKRTTRSCISCLQSYCPMHSNGNILFQRERGYVCNKHNPELPSQSTSTPPLRSEPIEANEKPL